MRLLSNLNPNYRGWRGYGVAVLAVIVALLLKMVLASLIPRESPFLLFFAAVIVSTWYGGLRPGLMATALAAFISDYFFLGAIYSLLGNKLGQNLELGIFVLEGISINVIITRLQTLKHRAQVSRLNAERHQESLRQSEERFRLLVEDVHDYAIFMLDIQGHFISWNIGAKRILGYAEAEVIGQPFSIIFTPEDIYNKRPEHALEIAVAEGRAIDDRWHIRKDGTRFWANGVVTPLRDEAGNLKGFSKILRDYTKKKQDQEALEKSEERLRLLIENVEDYAIFMLDPAGCVDSWNIGAERILGYQEAEIIGQPFSCLFPPEAVAQGAAEQELQEARVSGRSKQERWHVRKDGTRFWATDVTTALRDNTGILRGFSKVMRDITQRQLAEEERRQLLEREQAARSEAETANRAKDEFLSIVSHELRTPLAAILLWSQLLRAGNLNTATTAQALEIIERNAKSQSKLVEDLLDISRIITGNLHLSVQNVELIYVIQVAIDTLRLAAEAKAIQLQTIFDYSLVSVLGDPARLQQVVSNLLSNAIKFTPNGGQVKIQVACTESEVSIIISDTGIGISSQFLPYVFDRFRQANSTTSRSGSGLGLGLAIVRHLVELHGGIVRADSPGEGRGATFTVTLPLAPIPKAMTNQDLLDPRDNLFDSLPKLHGLWVLIVDDEADMREAISVVLKNCGAKVTAVATACEAFEAIAETQLNRRPDVLLCDIGLPDEDGYTLLRRVRAMEAETGGRIPSAALTAYARDEERQEALLAGFQQHLPKPFKPSELVVVVANLAGRY